jgi:hypothetical protein
MFRPSTQLYLYNFPLSSKVLSLQAIIQQQPFTSLQFFISTQTFSQKAFITLLELYHPFLHTKLHLNVHANGYLQRTIVFRISPQCVPRISQSFKFCTGTQAYHFSRWIKGTQCSSSVTGTSQNRTARPNQ